MNKSLPLSAMNPRQFQIYMAEQNMKGVWDAIELEQITQNGEPSPTGLSGPAMEMISNLAMAISRTLEILEGKYGD